MVIRRKKVEDGGLRQKKELEVEKRGWKRRRRVKEGGGRGEFQNFNNGWFRWWGKAERINKYP